jgi:hypothetical protein
MVQHNRYQSFIIKRTYSLCKSTTEQSLVYVARDIDIQIQIPHDT